MSRIIDDIQSARAQLPPLRATEFAYHHVDAARQKHWNIRVFACDVLAALKGRAALEGEQQ